MKRFQGKHLRSRADDDVATMLPEEDVRLRMMWTSEIIQRLMDQPEDVEIAGCKELRKAYESATDKEQKIMDFVVTALTGFSLGAILKVSRLETKEQIKLVRQKYNLLRQLVA